MPYLPFASKTSRRAFVFLRLLLMAASVYLTIYYTECHFLEEEEKIPEREEDLNQSVFLVLFIESVPAQGGAMARRTMEDVN